MEHSTRLGLSHERREPLVELLNSCLANTVDLALMAKHAHWNVQGPAFFSWHKLFDQVAEHLREQADRIAERAGALGGPAEGTARNVARRSAISEYDRAARRGYEHITALVDRLGVHSVALRAAVSQAGRAPLADPVTENLLIEVLDEVEADIWFLESHLLDGRRAPRGVETMTEEEAEEAEGQLFPT